MASPGPGVSSHNQSVEDRRVAVIGYSCTIPGASDVSEAWTVIRDGINAISEIPPDRVDVTAYYNPDPSVKDKMYCKLGGFIPDFEFNPREFNFNMLQMEDTDTNQILTLLKVKEALVSAGIEASGATKKNIGCVLGIGGGQKASHEFFSRLSYAVVEKVLHSMKLPEEAVNVAVDKFKAHYPEWRLDSFPGFLGNVTAGRVTNVFNMDGMNCVVDAACASSLAALKVAIDELLTGNVRTMITGATCTDNSIGMYMSFSKTPILTKGSSVKAYDSTADGILIGEGSVIFVLKRLADAISDGDCVHAVICGVGSSSDGKAPGIYAPTVEGQELCVRRAYRNAGIDPATVTLIEGHGTGTFVGDATELTSYSNVFGLAGSRRESIAIGSIKSNIGHLKAVAGFAGLMKAILALKHKTLPATINVRNPAILRDGRKLCETPLYLNTRMRPWFTPKGLPRRVGISSFGFGGSNYHCVLEESEQEQDKPYRVNACPTPVLLSATDTASLAQLVWNEVRTLETAIQDSKFHANSALREFSQRYSLKTIDGSHARVGFLVISAQNTVNALKAIQQELKRSEESWVLPSYGVSFRARAFVEGYEQVAALFVGQGSQYQFMMDSIAMNWPPFRRVVNAMDAAQERAGVDQVVSSVLYPRAPYEGESPVGSDTINDTRNAQPAIVVAALGVYDIFANAGFEPAFLGGHSLGELVALSAGGAFSRSSLFELVIERAKLMAGQEGGQAGTMAAVIGPNAINLSCQCPNVWVANRNSPDQIVISGSFESVESESKRFTTMGYRVVPLQVSNAFHTPYMEEAGKTFAKTLAQVNMSSLRRNTHVFSNVSGQEYGEKFIDLLSSHITSPVLFVEEIQGMYKAGARLFVEFGPGKSIANMISRILSPKADFLVISVNPAPLRCSDIQIREAAIAMAVAGLPFKQQFDPWGLASSSTADQTERKRTNLKLSAATFISPSTLEKRKKLMNNGYTVPVQLATETGVTSGKSLMPPDKYMVWGNTKEEPSFLTWHPLAGVNGNPTPGFKPTDFPPRPIAFIPFPGNSNDTNHTPGVLPLSWYNMAEFSCGSLSRCLGKEFARFDNSTTSRSPAFDLQLVTRVLSVTGLETGTFYGVDTNPEKGTMVSEFDCPVDAWFYKASSHDSYMPYSILMELGLQTAGILTSWVKAPLTLNSDNIVFRNLDATAELLRLVDCRGKTIVNKSSCSQYSMLGSLAIHRFVCELSLDGQPFYHVDTSFGWFLPEAFERQVGLDNGKPYTPWWVQKNLNPIKFLLPQDEAKIFNSFTQPLKRRSSQIEFLDSVLFISGGGIFNKGYAYGLKTVNPRDWFFSCHFWCDPVMPGSLGVESMIQLLELFCVHNKIPEAVKLKAICWQHNLGITKWKYRGQLTPKNKQMQIEIHVKKLEIIPGSYALLIADGYLIVENLRIYEITDLSVKLIGEHAPISHVTTEICSVNKLENCSEKKFTQPLTPCCNTESPTSIVLQTLSKATGYEVDLIELDMDLEQELGIDSIKRVEILSLVQSNMKTTFSSDKLAASRTVRDVITAVTDNSGTAQQMPPAQHTPPTVIMQSSVYQPDAIDFVPQGKLVPQSSCTSSAKELVLETLSKATGYDVSLIEMDMDLEQELGIDSIKRVEILSQVQAMVGNMSVDALSAARTVSDVINAVSNSQKASVAEPICKPSHSSSSGHSQSQETSTKDISDASSLVLDTLAAATGYEPDLIELDMDLEQELGIDSIKRVEILSLVQAKMGGNLDTAALSASRTVRDVIKAITPVASPANKVPAALLQVSATTKEANVTPIEPTLSEVDISWASYKQIPFPSEISVAWPSERPIVVVDGVLTGELLGQLAPFGCKIVVVTFPNEGPSASYDKCVTCQNREEDTLQNVLERIQAQYGAPMGFIYQHNATANAALQLKWLLLAAKHFSKPLHVPIPKGRTFFFAITHLDGYLGLQGNISAAVPSVDSILAAEEGGVFGLCKVLAIEWVGTVFVRGIDLSPSLSARDSAACILKELTCPDISLHEVGYSDNKRFTICPAIPPTSSITSGFTADDVVVVSGGARGITATCVIALTERINGGTFFLLGRSSLQKSDPDWAQGLEGQELSTAAMSWLKSQREIQQTPRNHKALIDQVESGREIRGTLAAIHKAGGTATYISCDVTDMHSVQRVVGDVLKISGKITGVIHGSGIVRDKRVEQKSGSDFDIVYGVKLQGLRCILGSLESSVGLLNLKHLIVFSSLAGYHGNGGQSDYAMANDALNKVAHRAASLLKSCRVLSMCFGPWDGGMVTPVLKSHFIKQGIQVISRDSGSKKVAAILSGNVPSVQLLMGNWETPPSAQIKETQMIKISLICPSPQLNSVLLCHEIQGRPVVPMMVVLGMLASTCLHVLPGWKIRLLENAHIFHGMFWQDDEKSALDCRIQLDPEKGSNNEARVKVKLFMQRQGQIIPTYATTVVLSAKESAPPSTNAWQTPTKFVLEASDIYNGETLFHGPLLQGIDSITAVNQCGLEAICHKITLTAEQAGQFSAKCDSFSADIAFQLLLVWVRTQKGVASLPASAACIEFFEGSLPQLYYTKLQIIRDEPTLVEGNVLFFDKQGRIFFRATGLVVNLSKDLTFQKSLPSPANSCKNIKIHQDIPPPRVAVVGMAVRFSGAPNKDAFWKVLLDGVVTTTNFTADNISSTDMKFLHCPGSTKHADVITSGLYGFLDKNSPHTEHKLLLDLASNAIHDAEEKRGEKFSSVNRCGLICGSLSFPHKNLQNNFTNDLYIPHFERELAKIPDLHATSDRTKWGSFSNTVNELNLDENSCDPATFVASKLGLSSGYCIDAACATALYALKLARDHLSNGDADMMLCGATCLPDPFFVLSGFSVFQALSNRSAPLASDTGGLVPSEGGAVLLLKRLDDAVRDKDYIYGVIRDVSLNNSGTGLPLKPNLDSEFRCLQRAYEHSCVNPSDVQYVECHATGTPVGDATELQTMRTFFKEKMPLIGSTKANFGHSLVAAGMAGLCKVLLALEKGIIPATPNLDGKAVDTVVVQENTAWPAGSSPRLAGVSAFGFGGTNAHAIIEEFCKDKHTSSSQLSAPQTRMAIIGMAAHFGKFRDLASFERAIFNGDDGARALPAKRWRFLAKDSVFLEKVLEDSAEIPYGCFVDSITIDFKKLCLPMTENDQLNAVHLIALSVIDAALTDTLGFIPKGSGANVAILVGLCTDMELYRHRARLCMREKLGLRGDQLPSQSQQVLLDYVEDPKTSFSNTSSIGNIIATRISSLWGLTGPSFTVNEGSNSVARCVEIASGLLTRKEVDAVVVAGVDLCGSAESVWSKVCYEGSSKYSKCTHPTASFSRDFNYFIGEGAGAFVLLRTEDLPETNCRAYAAIDSIASATSALEAAQRSLSQKNVASEVEIVETSYTSPVAELVALSEVYASQGQRNVAIGSVYANVGSCGSAYGAAAFIKAALCIYNRYIPQVPHWTGFEKSVEALLEKSSFYICPESRAWTKSEGSPRRIALSSTNSVSWVHALLSDLQQKPNSPHVEQYNVISVDPLTMKLVVLRGSSVSEILEQIDFSILHAETNATEELSALIFRTLREEEANASSNLAACIMASCSSLLQELKAARRGIAHAAESGSTWSSPAGSFFTANPIRSSQIALVYGDGTSPYYSLGYCLHRIWPNLHSVIDKLMGQLPRTKPWDINELSLEKIEQRKKAFAMQQLDLFSSGIYHSVCFTALVKELLGVKPIAAFGLSMGEVSMLFSSCPENSHLAVKLSEDLKTSPVWTSQLAGDFNVLRKTFCFPSDAPVSSFYQGYMVQVDSSILREALMERASFRARFTMVQSPNSCIVGGVPQDCISIFNELGVKYTPIDISLLMHCSDVVPYKSTISNLHSHLSTPSPSTMKLFSEVVPGPLPPNTLMGYTIAEMCSSFLNFPKNVERIFSEGFNVFIEVGPQNLRTLAIRDTLGSRTHLAVAIDRKGDTLWHSILCASAQLVSHCIPGIKLHRLYHPSLIRRSFEPRVTIREVTVNGMFSIENFSPLQREIDYQHQRAKAYKGPLIWDYDDLLQYAEGDIAPVFNKQLSGAHPPWSTIDSYSRRVRLPQRDYLLVSRVTHMSATTNSFAHSTIRTEYDLPPNGALSEGGDIPLAILVESGQCDLLLISYLGIDFQCCGKRVYRLLDATLTFHDVAQEGQTLCYEISIDSFSYKGDEVSLFFFHYDCFVDGKLVLEMRNGAAGFFNDEELASGQGIIHSAAEIKERQKIKKQDVTQYMLKPAYGKSTFSVDDMLFLSEFGGKYGWGKIIPTAEGVHHKLCARKMLMIDYVSYLAPHGGAHGLGLIVGEKILEPDHWYFPAHFRDDQVMAGSLVSEGCGQLLKLYMVWLGLHTAIEGNPTFRPLPGKANKVRCRGQIVPQKGRLIYVMEVKDIGFDAKTGYPYAITDVDVVNVNAELGQTFNLDDFVNQKTPLSSNAVKVVVDFKDISLCIVGARARSLVSLPPLQLPQLDAHVDSPSIVASLLDIDNPCSLPTTEGGSTVLPAVPISSLGDAAFKQAYGVNYPIFIGSMAKGISSASIVKSAGNRLILASLGAGGLPIDVLEGFISEIQSALPSGPFAVNLIHNPFSPASESACVDLFLQKGIRVVEASAFMSLTPSIVRYRVSGIVSNTSGRVTCNHKVLFKVSRTEIAELALRPPPANIVSHLLSQGLITPKQADLARLVPMADDIIVEADSGGHTDNRPLNVIFPLIKALAARINREQKYAIRVRVGAAGGIGCPEAVVSAFSLGAAFVVTGTINQLSKQSGTSNRVRELLAKATYSDVTMAPSADMFDEGVKLQVLKRGTMFPARAKKLYDIFIKYPSLDTIPQKEVEELEKTIFKRPLSTVWEKTVRFYTRLGDKEKVEQAEINPKLKMSLVFRWYLGKSSIWAQHGKQERSADFQIWCGPCIGSYNEFVAGTALDPKVLGDFPCVIQQNLHLLRGACYLSRLSQVDKMENIGEIGDIPAFYQPLGTL